MAFFQRTLMDIPSPSHSRVAWADIAKALSMILLVGWTLGYDRVYINEMLIFVRMPLFFFVSGLFAWRIITHSTLRELLRDKVANFLFLYALWETLLFIFRAVPQHVLNGRPLDFGKQLSLFWDPIFNMWFLYALAIAFLVAWLVRRAPVWIVLAASVALYLLSVSDGQWRFNPFTDRVVRLFPFFWLGLMVRPMAGRVIDASYRFWPVALGLFLTAAFFAYDPRWLDKGVLTFAVSSAGIFALLLVSRQLADLPKVAQVLTIVGGSTIYIYLTHKIVIFYLGQAMMRSGLAFPGHEILMLPIVVAVCTIGGRAIAREPALSWLFTAPWLRQPRRRSGLVPAE
jgi:uncharacterized membrane protein YcfT